MNAQAQSVSQGTNAAIVAGAAKAAKAASDRIEETVQMKDGRKVTFVGKKLMLKEPIFSTDGRLPSVRFDFRDGQTITFNLEDHKDVKTTDGELLLHALAAHGASQKIGDEAAGVKTGPSDMFLEIEDMIERLGKGEWSAAREGGGFGGTSILMKALVESSGKSIEAIKVFLKGKGKAEKDALRASPRLKPIVDRLEAEEAAKSAHVDTASLFSELDSVAG